MNVWGKVSRIVVLFSLLSAGSALAQQARISVTKSAAPSPVTAGTDLTYTIVASNEGPDPATGTTLSDPLPSGTTFASLAPEPGWSCTTPAVNGTGTVNCSIASFAVGSATFTLVVHTDPSLAAGSTITNTVTIASATPDPRTSDNTAMIDTPVVASSDLSIAKSAPAAVNAGANITYTLTYGATGPSNAQGVTITDTLPAGTTFASATAPGFTCTGGATVTCTANADLAPNASGTITIVVNTDPTLTTGTMLMNSAAITSSTSDPNSANDSSSASTQVTSSSDLGVIKTGSAAVAGGTTFWSVSYSAGGPSTAANVTITDTVPAGTTITSVTPPAGWSCTSTATTVTCTIAALPSGASGSIVINASVAPTVSGTLSNSATIASASTTDPNPANNTSLSSSPVTNFTDVGVTITDAPDPVFPGSTLTYTVAVTNGGPSAALNATLTVNLSPQTTFTSISSNPGWSCTTGQTIVCTNPSLTAPSTTFTITTTTINPFTAPTIVTTASVSTTANDANAANDVATATTTAQPYGALSAAKTHSGGTMPGDSVTYTIVLSNTGGFAQADNPGDELTDVLPSALTLVSASSTSGTTFADVAANTVHFNGAIPMGGSVTITINAKIKNQGSLVGTTVTNQATTHYDRDGNGTNETTGSSNADTFVVGAPAVPTLSEWTLVLLAALLAFAGYRAAIR